MERHHGIAELLEILGSIINGCALPLKDEHINFLNRALIPLHKSKSLPLFHPQLAYCVLQFVDKDPCMAIPVLRGLIRSWPHCNTPKQILFLGEFEDVLELTEPEEFKQMVPEVFLLLRDCVSSDHFQVAERALFMWNNEILVSHIAENRQELLPMLMTALKTTSEEHWNPNVVSLSANVLSLFEEMDPTLYAHCAENFKTIALDHASESSLEDRMEQWMAL